MLRCPNAFQDLADCAACVSDARRRDGERFHPRAAVPARLRGGDCDRRQHPCEQGTVTISPQVTGCGAIGLCALAPENEHSMSASLGLGSIARWISTPASPARMVKRLRRGSALVGDWTTQPLELFSDVVLDSCAKTGLVRRLEEGARWETLVGAGFNPRLMRVLLVALQELGAVWRDQDGMWRWRATCSVTASRARVKQVERWLTLASRLRPQGPSADVTSEVAWTLERLDAYGRPLYDWLVSHLPVVRGQRWLDLGAGSGRLAHALAAKGAEVVAVERPTVARSWPLTLWPAHVQPWIGDLRTAYPPGDFDGITLVRVIEQLAPGELQLVLGAMRCRLRPHGGIYVAGYVLGRSPYSGLFGLDVSLDPDAAHSYSWSQLLGIGYRAGLIPRAVSIHPEYGYRLVTFGPRPTVRPAHRPKHRRQCARCPHCGHRVKKLAMGEVMGT